MPISVLLKKSELIWLRNIQYRFSKVDKVYIQIDIKAFVQYFKHNCLIKNQICLSHDSNMKYNNNQYAYIYNY